MMMKKQWHWSMEDLKDEENEKHKEGDEPAGWRVFLKIAACLRQKGKECVNHVEDAGSWTRKKQDTYRSILKGWIVNDSERMDTGARRRRETSGWRGRENNPSWLGTPAIFSLVMGNIPGRDDGELGKWNRRWNATWRGRMKTVRVEHICIGKAREWDRRREKDRGWSEKRWNEGEQNSWWRARSSGWTGVVWIDPSNHHGQLSVRVGTLRGKL